MLKAGCPWVAVGKETALSVWTDSQKGPARQCGQALWWVAEALCLLFFSFINYSFIEAGSMVTVMQFFFPRMTSLANFWISAEVRVL